jgi:MFS superfamily sulfate permease-like transporter
VPDRIVILELQGYLVFGSGHRLSEEIRSILLTDPDVRHVVLDLRRVAGADSTATRNLERIARQVAAADATLVLVALPAARSRALDLDPLRERDGVRLLGDDPTRADGVEGSLRADLIAEVGDEALVNLLLGVEDPRLAAAVHRYLARLLGRRLRTSLRTIEALER